MIKAIIFDLGKTLIPFDFDRGYRALEGVCSHSTQDIRKRLSETDLVERFETGLVEPRAFVHEFCGLFHVDLAYDEFCRIWSLIFLPETLVPEQILESLASRYRLVLLSNTNAIHFEMVRANYPLLRHFHEMVLSYEVHRLKPSADIYRIAIDRAGCRPEECFFTDDIAAYVEAARSQGIDAVRFESCAQLERELQARGVSCWNGAGCAP